MNLDSLLDALFYTKKYLRTPKVCILNISPPIFSSFFSLLGLGPPSPPPRQFFFHFFLSFHWLVCPAPPSPSPLHLASQSLLDTYFSTTFINVLLIVSSERYRAILTYFYTNARTIRVSRYYLVYVDIHILKSILVAIPISVLRLSKKCTFDPLHSQFTYLM